MNDKCKTTIVIALIFLITSSIIALDSDESDAVNVTTSDDFIDKVANSTSTFIDLTQDITLSGNCEINRTLTIDLNNYNIEFSSGGFIVNSSLTIKDDKAEGEPVINQDNALTYDSGVISSLGTTITVTEKGLLTISDGTVKSTGGCAILNESKVTTKTSITVNGGAIVSQNNADEQIACGICNDSTESINIMGGVILADKGVGILVRDGSVDIWGGEIVSTGDASVSGTVGDDTTSLSAYALVVETSDNSSASAWIHSGKLISSIDGVVSQVGGDPAVDPKITITAGYFSSTPDNNFMTGNKFNAETGEVTKSTDVATVIVNGNIGYSSLDEALLNCNINTMDIILKQDDVIDVACPIPAGKTVTLDLSDCTLTVNVVMTVSSGASLTIKDTGTGGKITSDSSDPTLNVNGGTLNLYSGAIENHKGTTVRVTGSATFNMYGGEIVSGPTYGVLNMGTTTIYGGKLTSDDNQPSIHASKGTLAITPAAGSIVEIDVLNPYRQVINITGGTIGVVKTAFGEGTTISNATFGMDLDNLLPSDLVSVKDEGSDTWHVVKMTEENTVAKIVDGDGDETPYASLVVAAKNMDEGQTLVLLKPYSGEQSIVVSVLNGTVDLNGNSITNTSDDGIALEIHSPGSYDGGSGKVTVKSDSDASISGPVSLSVGVSISSTSVEIVLDGVTLAPVQGGTALELNSNTYIGYNETTGGYLANGGFVAEMEDGTQRLYGQMAPAVQVSKDHTAVMIHDYNGTLSINSSGEFTLDLNGHKVNASNQEALDLSVDDCTLTVKNGSLISTYDADELADPDFNGSAVDVGIGMSGSSYSNIGLILDNVKVSTNGVFGIVTNGNDRDIDISLKESVVESDSVGIYFPSTGTLEIENSQVTGESTGVEVRRGTVSITGNDTVLTGNGQFSTTDAQGKVGVMGVGLSVVPYDLTTPLDITIKGGTFVGSYGLYEKDILGESSGTQTITGSEMAIQGGTFIGKTGSILVSDAENEGTTPVLSDFISGGSFYTGTVDSKQPDSSLDDGYVADGFQLTGGNIELAEGDAVVKLNDTQYTTLADALNDLSNGDTLTLLTDLIGSITIQTGLDVTLDLNGFTLTNTDGEHTITNNGTLTVIDGSDAKTGKVDNVSNGKAAVMNEVGATAYLEGGTYLRSKETGSSPSEGGTNSYYNIVNHGTMTISAGVTVSQEGHFSSLVENGWYNGSQNATGTPSVMTIKGGTFTGGLNTIKNDDYGKITITGGTFTNVTHAAVLNWNEATITGGTFSVDGEGAEAVVLNGKIDDTMDKGTLTITGGNFTGPVGVKIMTGSGSQGIGAVKVSGGDFQVTDKVVDPLSGTATDIEVSGGTFSKAVEPEYLADGFALTETDGKFGVGEGHKVTFSANVEGFQVSVTSEDGNITYTPETDGSYVLADGSYKAVFTLAGYNDATKTFEVSGKDTTVSVEMTEEGSEPEPEPTPGGDDDPVSPPAGGDDDESLPPIIRPGESGSSSSDDTVTTVACAAAAAVAAILAVFLIYAYRKD